MLAEDKLNSSFFGIKFLLIYFRLVTRRKDNQLTVSAITIIYNRFKEKLTWEDWKADNLCFYILRSKLNRAPTKINSQGEMQTMLKNWKWTINGRHFRTLASAV